MKKLLAVLMLFASFAHAEPRIGMNFYAPEDWSSELPFVDVFHGSRPWISQKTGAAYGQGPKLSLDEAGWVKNLDTGCSAETVMCNGLDGHYPSGVYTVFYEGAGKIEFSGSAKISASNQGQISIDVDAAKGMIILRIIETDPKNYIRHIHVIMPGTEKAWEREPFDSTFLKKWKGFACFRFMDWMQTNNSEIRKWSDRPTLEHQTFSKLGVPLEVMIDLCNRQKVDAWFCMPHQADDDYIRHFAQMVKDRLDPKLKAYVEYSNEVWNGQFKQNHYACDEGTKLNLGAKPWEAGWHYTALRSVQIFKIWEEVFGGHERFVRVIPTQSGNSFISEQILGFAEAGKHADALAFAPYMALIVGADSKPDVATVSAWSVDQVLDYTEQQALPAAITAMQRQKQAADKYGLKLVAYEAGQHLVGKGSGLNNDAMTKLFHAANRHPRMGKIYSKYLDAWAGAGGDLLNHFSSTGKWVKYGSWSLSEYHDSNPADYPKLAAVLEWAKKHGQAVEVGK